MRGVNFSSPRNRENAHRALAARDTVRVARPLRGAAPCTLLREVIKNTGYRSLALKTAKKRVKSDVRNDYTRKRETRQNGNIYLLVKTRTIATWKS